MFGPKPSAVVLSTILLLSACYLPPSLSAIPKCPMGSPYEYLSCVFEVGEGEYDEEEIWMLSQATSRYCDENAGEWMPVLDRNARKSANDLKRYALERVREGEFDFSEYRDLNDKEIFQATITLYLAKPLMLGTFSTQSESCLTLFEEHASGGLMEWVKEREEENK